MPEMRRVSGNGPTYSGGLMGSAVFALTVAVCVCSVLAKPDAEVAAGAAAAEYPPQYLDAPLDAEYVLLKKADAPPVHWNRLYNEWGKRADQWKNLNHLWGKRAIPVATRWDKRPQPQWNELSGYWGKRSAQ